MDEKPRVSLATRTVVALLLGAGVGLFFGERVAFLSIAGDAFVLLLQMTVLPYVSVSLIYGLGSINAGQAAALTKRAGGFLLALWALALAAVLLAPLAFPDWKSASFFSTQLVESRAEFEFVRLFIPANPFRALSDGVVPAVVVFSLAFATALIGISDARKQPFLDSLGVISDSLARITSFVVRLAPYGVFAIAGSAAGTLSLEEAQGLQVYAAVFIALSLLMTFWTLPALVVTLTPFRYREVVWATRDALVTAFATGSLFVVLAMVAEKSKELIEPHVTEDEETDRLVDVVTTTSYAFPSAGKLLSLSFVLFAGWMSGYAVGVGQLPGFLGLGSATFFGSPMSAVPILLDQFQIPADAFQLFVVAEYVVGTRFGVLLAAMHTIALVLLTACATAGVLRVRAVAVIRYLAITLLLTLLTLGAVRVAFETLGREYRGYQTFVEMQPLFEPIAMRELDGPPRVLPAEERQLPVLDRIRKRGVLRVGFFSDSLPFSFKNSDGMRVGFDIEMATLLARDLGVGLELVRIEPAAVADLLAAGYLDTVMSGMLLTADLLDKMAFSAPYLDETLAFLVRDHHRHVFSNLELLRLMESPRIAVLDVPYYTRMLQSYLPQAEVVVLESPRDFLRDESGELDAMLFSAEAGSAWSLIYPEFSVAVPKPDLVSIPLAYPLARGEEEMARFLSAWIELKRKDGTISQLYERWILGQSARASEARWSVIHDVLGWVD